MRQILGVLLCFFILLLAGCANPTRINESVDSQFHQQKLATLSHWKIKGRLAFKSPEEKVSAYINWQQQDQSYQLSLNTFIGINIMKMEGNLGYAMIEADDQTFTDKQASTLIQRVTGWNIPVESLALWIKGQHTEQDNVVFSDSGLLASLTAKCTACAPWQLTYSNYKQVDGVLLPHMIQLDNTIDSRNQIKIKITSWQQF